jgi:hypothetical protein
VDIRKSQSPLRPICGFNSRADFNDAGGMDRDRPVPARRVPCPATAHDQDQLIETPPKMSPVSEFFDPASVRPPHRAIPPRPHDS